MIISNQKLKEMGFVKIQDAVHEPEFSYDWMRFSKGNSNLEVTTEYDLEGKPKLQYFDFNGEKLTGKLIRPFEIKFIKELM